MKILILGGHGRLGSAMRRLWGHHELVTPSREEVNIFDEQAVEEMMRKLKPDTVINCIAYNNVDGAEGMGKTEAMRLNSELPGMLARVTARSGVAFIHFSTDCVFLGNQVEGYTEMDAPDPMSEYGRSKYEGERNVLRENPQAYIVRTSRLFGPNGDSAGAKRSFVELIIEDARKAARVLVNREEVTAPTLVDDLVHHLDEHLLQRRPDPGIYHMSNEGQATWYEWASEIKNILNLPTVFAPRDAAELRRPAQRPLYSSLRSTKLPALRPWQEALKYFLSTYTIDTTPHWKALGIAGLSVELQPCIGEPDGAVLHMLPGGIKNAHGFGGELLDVYASTAKGKGIHRGGHYHLKLEELFFTMSGTALWILSDFREGSSTHGKTAGVILGVETPSETHGFPCYTIADGSLPRLRVPAGVYHAFYPLTDERVVTVAIGSTSYDKEDYRYPTEIPGIEEILQKFGILFTTESTRK